MLEHINSIIWGPFTILFILIIGIYHTVRSGFIQLRLPFVMKKCGRSGIRSVTSALAASMGTGNITGCAAAIAAGGPGAVFWMWVSAFLGMGLAYAENRTGAEYAQRYNDSSKGPMLYIEKALSEKAAAVYAVICLCAAVIMGCMSQSAAMTDAISVQLSVPCGVIAVFPAIITAAVIFSSKNTVNSVMNVTEKLVPLMGIVYLGGCFLFLAVGKKDVLSAFSEIIADAFTFRAVSGGITGTAVGNAVSVGLRRGIFSNEAGMGSSVLIHTEADFGSAEAAGAWSAFEVFLDTIVCCTLTALTLLTSDADKSLNDIFDSVFGNAGGLFVCVCVCLFAWAAMLGWCCYGSKCLGYLTSSSSADKIYRLIYSAAAFIGGAMSVSAVFGLCDIINAALIFPNLAAVTLISVINGKKCGNYLESDIKCCYNENIKSRKEP